MSIVVLDAWWSDSVIVVPWGGWGAWQLKCGGLRSFPGKPLEHRGCAGLNVEYGWWRTKARLLLFWGVWSDIVGLFLYWNLKHSPIIQRHTPIHTSIGFLYLIPFFIFVYTCNVFWYEMEISVLKTAVLKFSIFLFLDEAWWCFEVRAEISSLQNNFNVCCMWRTVNEYSL